MLVTAAPPVTVVDGLVGIAVLALIAAATTLGDEDIVDTRFIVPVEFSTFVTFNSLVIVLPVLSNVPSLRLHITSVGNSRLRERERNRGAVITSSLSDD